LITSRRMNLVATLPDNTVNLVPAIIKDHYTV
jgi:hypothetical protein